MSDWHPMLAAVEVEPARWVMISPQGERYGEIELRRTPDGPRYRVTRGGEVIGWATSLRLSCERVHQEYLRAHGPQGAAYTGPRDD